MRAENKVKFDDFSKDDLKHLVLELKKRYEIKDSEIKEISNRQEISAPITVFSGRLSPLESIVYYLKYEKGMSLSKIADLLKRKQPTVWTAFKNARNKNPTKPKDCMINIPTNILADSSLSILEVVVTYLRKEYHLSFAQIGSLLNKDQRTVWTAHNRGVQKRK